MSFGDLVANFRSTRFRALAVFVLSAALFVPTTGHPFSIYDDPLNVTENTSLPPAPPTKLLRFWLAPYEGLYAPVSYTAYGAIAAVSQLTTGDARDPRWFHAVNVVLHAGAAVMVMLCLGRLGVPPGGDVCGALVFAWHPLQVESVAWVTETRGLLAGFLGLAALAVYWRGDRRWGSYLAACVLFALALLSKPTATAVPLLALAADLLILRRRWRESLAWLAPWFAMAVLLALATRSQQDVAGAPFAYAWSERPYVALHAVAHYLEKLLVPWGLAADYGRTPGWMLDDPRRLNKLCGFLLFLLVLGAFPSGRKLLIVLTLFVAALAPSLGFIPFAFQEHSTVADRFAYFALLAAAYAAGRLYAIGRVARGALGVVLVVLAALSWRQEQIWRSDATLFAHTVAINPASRLATNNLGIALTAEKRYREAIIRLGQGVVVHPGDSAMRNSLGLARLAAGDPSGASSDFAAALTLASHDLRIRNNLGRALAAAERWSEAIEQFELILAQAPHYANVHVNLARALLQLSHREAAEQHLLRALELDPDDGDARRELERLRAMPTR